MKNYTIAVVGATGAVGSKMTEMLEESGLPIGQMRFLASKRSAGKTIQFKGKEHVIEELTEDSFEGIDIALFSAGGSITEKFAPIAVSHGAVVIDNTSALRMKEEVPLVVPEVNKEALKTHKGLIANPNCSTIQMMVALEPIRQAYGLSRIIVSTYQAVSGAGVEAISEMEEQSQAILSGEKVPEATVLPCSGDKKHYQLGFNVLPQIDVFGDEDYTLEEWKMMNETKKIMSDASLKVAATCVRVPVLTGHSESVYIEIKEEGVSVSDIKDLLRQAPGVTLQDDPSQQIYPQPIDSVDKKDVFVGRIRQDVDEKRGFHLWVVSDNLVKGASWNSVQIAESLHELNLVSGWQ